MDQIQHGLDTLLMLDQLGFLTSLNVAKIFFWGEMTGPNPKHPPHLRNLNQARNAANEMCLRRLKDHRFVEVIPVGDNPSPNVLRRTEFNLLTKLGADYVQQQMGDEFQLNWTPGLRRSSILNFKHKKLINDTLSNLMGAFRQAGGVVELVLNDDQLRNRIETGQTYLGNIHPDAVLLVNFNGVHRAYLLEVDTGTMPVAGQYKNSFDRKIPKYERYFKDRFVIDPFFKGMRQPQVLVVTSGAKRAENLKDAIYSLGGRRAYAISTFDWLEPPQFTALGEVWHIPSMKGFQRLQFD